MIGDPTVSPMKRKNSSYEPQRIFVGVTGGSAAGKTTLCETIRREIQYDSDVDMTILSLDSFYKGVDKTKIDISQYNFDHPDALDWDLAYEIIQTLLQGRPAKVPTYCFVTHQRLEKYEIVMPSQVIVFEGILALYDERIRSCMAYKIFIYCDDDIRLCRRILRDVQERGRTVQSVLYQYNKYVKTAFEEFIAPSMGLADIIIPGSRDNHISVSFIVNHLKNLAKQMGILREKLMNQVYFGDLLYQLQGFISPKQIHNADQYLSMEMKPYKQLFFPTEETMKQEYLYLVQNFFAGKLTTEKQIFKVFKSCHKLTYQLFDKALAQEKINPNQIQAVNMKSLLSEDGSINVDLLTKEVAVLSMPVLFGKGFEFVQQLASKLKKTNKQTKIIIINVFSDIKVIQKIGDLFRSVKVLVNAFLVGRLDRIFSLLKCENDEPNFLYEQDKFFSKTEKHLQKMIQNQKQE